MRRKIEYRCYYGEPLCEGINACVISESGDLDFCPICGHNDIVVLAKWDLPDDMCAKCGNSVNHDPYFKACECSNPDIAKQ